VGKNAAKGKPVGGPWSCPRTDIQNYSGGGHYPRATSCGTIALRAHSISSGNRSPQPRQAGDILEVELIRFGD